MRCPKCGYVSFDYNQVCPKCNKNINEEQVKMNLPSFRPDPPSLLGALTGEAEESNVGFQVDSTDGMGDSAAMGLEEMDIEEDQGMEISLEPDDSGELELPLETDESVEDLPVFDLGGEEGEEISLDTGDISLEEGGGIPAPSEAEGEEEIALDLGDISLAEPEEEISIPDDAMQKEGELSISLDKLTPDISEAPEDIVVEEEIDKTEESDASLDSVAMEVGEEAEAEETSEIEINLDDLTINETGELEIGTDFEPPAPAEEVTPDESAVKEEDGTLDLGEIELGEALPEADEATQLVEDLGVEEISEEEAEEELDLGDLAIDESALEEETEEPLDLEGIELEEPSPIADEKSVLLEDLNPEEPTKEEDGGEEEELDLGDLSLDESAEVEGEETNSEDDDKTLVYDEQPTLGGAALEEMISDTEPAEAAEDAEDDVNLDAVSLNVDGDQGISDLDDDLTIDLENLDIDLDLDESEDKS